MKRTRTLLLLAAAALSFAALLAERGITGYERSPYFDEMKRAAETMASAERLIRAARIGYGIAIDPVHDPNGTGLIGEEYTETTTSAGDLEAKRTTANPDMAALMVLLFKAAGVKRGDAIAVGASGSFPAATVAVLSAARTLDLEVALIVSLGASTWGANVPGFSYLRMHEATRPALGYDILAVALGGGRDSGGDMGEEGRSALASEMADSGLYVIAEKGTAASADKRMIVYDNFFFDRRCSAFVNIGGASANVGEGLSVLELKPGLNLSTPPPEGDGGVVYEMGARGVPVIHLLNIRKLAGDNGVPWDPVPFPAIGASRVFRTYDRAVYRKRLLLLTAVYFSVLAALALLYRGAVSKEKRRG